MRGVYEGFHEGIALTAFAGNRPLEVLFARGN